MKKSGQGVSALLDYPVVKYLLILDKAEKAIKLIGKN